MIMIYQSLHARKEFSALVKLAMKHTADTEHLTKILQHYYDLACQAAIPKRRRNKRPYMKMADLTVFCVFGRGSAGNGLPFLCQQ